MRTVNIIGAGFGGLSLAIRLQTKGFKVRIFEKNNQAGGHANQIKEKGFTFDMGPSLITAPEIIQRIFECAGKNMDDYLEMHRLDPFYRVYFHDKTFIDYSGDSISMKEQMSRFNTKDTGNYDDFIKFSERIYHAVITDGLGSQPFNTLSTMFKFLPKAVSTKALLPAYSITANFFEDFRHRFLFSFHPLFIGGNPFRVPSIYLMISYLEKQGGIWYCKGGMYSLVEALTKIFIEAGGEILTNSEVEAISVKSGKADGIIACGEYYKSDLVVSNADVTHTYRHLINKQYIKKWTDKKIGKTKYSMSCFVIYLGVKKQYQELLHHTLILSSRYKELVEDIFDNNILPDDYSMYLHVPSRTDSTMAPEGCESMYVLIPVTNLKANLNWQEYGKIFADKIIDSLENEFGLNDLKANLDYISFFTPQDFAEQRNSYLGSPWGMEPTLLQTAYFRPHNISEEIENLYFVGAGTHPGAGVPGVMLSAEATEKLIIEKFS